MPRLDEQDAAYVGAEPVNRIMLGGLEVWTPPTPGVPVIIGDQGSGGGGNWPTQGDRALLRKITVAAPTTLTQFNMRIRDPAPNPEVGGDRFKGLVYAADGTGGNPGTLVAVSSPTPPNAGGPELLTAPVANVLIPAGEYWIGYVCDGGSGGGVDTDSGGTAPNVTIMFNSGETNYASPSNPAGNWAGTPGPYNNIPALWFDGLA